MTPVVEKFFLDLPRAVKNYNRKCALKVECVDVVRPWVHEFFNRRLIWEEILWIDNLRLILFVVIKKCCLLWFHWFHWWEEKHEALIFIFVLRSTLIVGGWWVVSWGRKSYLRPAEIASFCSWFYSRMGDEEWVQDFIFSFLVLIKGMSRRSEFKISLRDPSGGEILLRSSASC